MQDAWQPVYKTTDHGHQTVQVCIDIVLRFDWLTPLNTLSHDTPSIMTGAEGLTIGAAAIRRRELTGKSGMSALMENKKAFFIAIFASFVLLFLEQKRKPADASAALEAFSMATSRVFSDKRLLCQLSEHSSPPSTLPPVLLDG
jgi:hypothetical protein